MIMRRLHRGFSLTEVLLAVGTLAIGMIFIAGVFPVGIHFTTVATERTIAAVAADEAFAKVKIYGDRYSTILLSALSTTACVDFSSILSLDPNEFAYPSTKLQRKQYFWSALCRRVESNDVQVTVFVSRRVGGGNRPILVRINVATQPNADELRIIGEKTQINDGYTIVDDENGRLYRVLERYPATRDNIILLDRRWEPEKVTDMVWTVPPAAGGSRYPCIAVYQKTIRF